MVAVKIEFEGGLDHITGGLKKVDAEVEGETIRHVIQHIRQNVIQERPELFCKDDSVRPGILVLVNDCDWELCGRLDAKLDAGDTVVFISTLHGG